MQTIMDSNVYPIKQNLSFSLRKNANFKAALTVIIALQLLSKMINADEDSSSLDLLPERKSLFGHDSIDLDQLNQIDCHLRNVDFCYAGLLGASAKMLPESEPELEARCDEMRVTSSCLAIYNERCASYKAFGALAPLMQQQQQQQQRSQQMALMPKELTSMQIPLDIAYDDNNDDNINIKASQDNVTLADFINICEPQAKSEPKQRLIKRRLFSLGKCLNARLPQMAPCLDDLKVSLQLFYEPARVLPLKPSCCAISRFRKCSIDALDNVCGLSSFESLANSFASMSTTGNSLKLVERICRNSSDFKSDYCKEMLPPPGTKIATRRASKASKLAKALDLLSFSQISKPTIQLK